MGPATHNPAGTSEGEYNFPKELERKFRSLSCGDSEKDERASEGEDAFPKEVERQFSTLSYGDFEECECESATFADESIVVRESGGESGQLVTLKEQLERNREDESLRRWKENLLGSSAHLNSQVVESEVKFLTVGMTSPGRSAITIPLPVTSIKGVTFSLKEGSTYRLKYTFSVHHKIVSGLKCVNTVWKGGWRVAHTKIMLGTFSPQLEPYTWVMAEERTLSGFLARGSYSAKTKFVDDDKRCYMEIDFWFDIRKEWGSL